MAEIYTSNGAAILVDAADYDELNAHRWYLNNYGYAVRKVPHPVKEDKQYDLSMHRHLLGLEFGDKRHSDHANGNKLDNRRGNLRICTLGDNNKNRGKMARNTSGLKGISRRRDRNKWRASIMADGRTFHIGDFDTAEEAHAAYCETAKKLHGEFANFGV
jgi:AP2 domain